MTVRATHAVCFTHLDYLGHSCLRRAAGASTSTGARTLPSTSPSSTAGLPQPLPRLRAPFALTFTRISGFFNTTFNTSAQNYGTTSVLQVTHCAKTGYTFGTTTFGPPLYLH